MHLNNLQACRPYPSRSEVTNEAHRPSARTVNRSCSELAAGFTTEEGQKLKLAAADGAESSCCWGHGRHWWVILRWVGSDFHLPVGSIAAGLISLQEAFDGIRN
jgi:hypothetical protein